MKASVRTKYASPKQIKIKDIQQAIPNDKGVYISSELGPYSQYLFYALSTSFSSKLYFGVFSPIGSRPASKKVIFPLTYSIQKTIPYISNLLNQGKYKPVIDREYILDDIAKAYEYVITGVKTGNVIINIS